MWEPEEGTQNQNWEKEGGQSVTIETDTQIWSFMKKVLLKKKSIKLLEFNLPL